MKIKFYFLFLALLSHSSSHASTPAIKRCRELLATISHGANTDDARDGVLVRIRQALVLLKKNIEDESSRVKAVQDLVTTQETRPPFAVSHQDGYTWRYRSQGDFRGEGKASPNHYLALTRRLDRILDVIPEDGSKPISEDIGKVFWSIHPKEISNILKGLDAFPDNLHKGVAPMSRRAFLGALGAAAGGALVLPPLLGLRKAYNEELDRTIVAEAKERAQKYRESKILEEFKQWSAIPFWRVTILEHSQYADVIQTVLNQSELKTIGFYQSADVGRGRGGALSLEEVRASHSDWLNRNGKRGDAKQPSFSLSDEDHKQIVKRLSETEEAKQALIQYQKWLQNRDPEKMTEERLVKEADYFSKNKSLIEGSLFTKEELLRREEDRFSPGITIPVPLATAALAGGAGYVGSRKLGHKSLNVWGRIKRWLAGLTRKKPPELEEMRQMIEAVRKSSKLSAPVLGDEWLWLGANTFEGTHYDIWAHVVLKDYHPLELMGIEYKTPFDYWPPGRTPRERASAPITGVGASAEPAINEETMARTALTELRRQLGRQLKELDPFENPLPSLFGKVEEMKLQPFELQRFRDAGDRVREKEDVESLTGLLEEFKAERTKVSLTKIEEKLRERFESENPSVWKPLEKILTQAMGMKLEGYSEHGRFEEMAKKVESAEDLQPLSDLLAQITASRMTVLADKLETVRLVLEKRLGESRSLKDIMDKALKMKLTGYFELGAFERMARKVEKNEHLGSLTEFLSELEKKSR